MFLLGVVVGIAAVGACVLHLVGTGAVYEQ